MKVLFWFVSVLSIAVGLVFSFIAFMVRDMGLAATAFGEIMCIAGMLSWVVAIVGMVVGRISLRKGKKMLAILFALLGVIYGGIFFGGLAIDDIADTNRHESQAADRNEQLYGENWNETPAIEGLPEQY